jgi:signal transduction histidine kinase
VSVRDTGCGIAPERLEEIFESFHSGKAEGLGLGLSIARAIVKAHGGHIFASNNLHGPGATVAFELPVDASTAPRPAQTLLPHAAD